MSTVIAAIPSAVPPPGDPYYYGWRDVIHTLPNGVTTHEQIPLTLEDTLHPQEGDHIVESDLHTLLREYLAGVFRIKAARIPQSLVLSNTGVYWDHPDLEHHAPDVCVIFGVTLQKTVRPSFQVREEGTKPHSIVEIVSPNTRKNDVETKLIEYHIAEVPFYFIFDKKREEDSWTLRGYRWTKAAYVSLVPDVQGRLWLEALGIWLSAEGQNIVCYDGQTNERIGNFAEVSANLQTAQTDLHQAVAREQLANQRADSEMKAREAAEAKIKELEARLRGQVP